MALFVDARIPVAFGVVPGERDVVLQPGAAAHPVGCSCCVARAPGATALDRLFLDRVRGVVPWFSRVVVAGEDEALRAALVADPVLVARFRVE